MAAHTIRDLNPDSETEIAWVAQRMRQTLIEVLGAREGESLYSMEWLADRVRWHLDAAATRARVLLAEDAAGRIIGHAIARVELDESGACFGYFSTLFVEPDSRRQGVASALMDCVVPWFTTLALSKVVYNTAKDNAKLIKLFAKHHFVVTVEQADMVQLTRQLPLHVQPDSDVV